MVVVDVMGGGLGQVGVRQPTLTCRWAGLQAASEGGRVGGGVVGGSQEHPLDHATGRSVAVGGWVGRLRPPPPLAGSVGEGVG